MKQFEMFLIQLDQWLEEGVNDDGSHTLIFCDTDSRPLKSDNHRIYGLCGMKFLTLIYIGRRAVGRGIQQSQPTG